MPTIVVVGAGVSGLTSALLLSKDKSNKITVVAKHMPGDYDIEYASPFAGANVLPMATEPNSRWERRTWPELKRLAVEVPEAGIHQLREDSAARLYRREKDVELLRSEEGALANPMFVEHPWYQALFDDYRALRRDELPPGVASGAEFGSVCINTMLYLPWLVGQCRARGVVFRRGVLGHVADAARLGVPADPAVAVVVVNCAGLGARRLGGVADTAMAPIRGQVVVVRNPAPYMAGVSGIDDDAHPGAGDDEMAYVMTRAAGGGTVLGGTYAKGAWESQPDPSIAVRIMRRAVELVPELTGGRGLAGLDVIRHAVGLRPFREGGVRIEKERVAGTWVVHNYGHSGWGYQGSYGCAERVVELVDEIRSQAKL